jgi:hypothetical protein
MIMKRIISFLISTGKGEKADPGSLDPVDPDGSLWILVDPRIDQDPLFPPWIIQMIYQRILYADCLTEQIRNKLRITEYDNRKS